MQGAMLSLHKITAGQDKTEKPLSARDVLPMLFTFCLVSFSWIFFRGASLEGSLAMIEGLVSWRGPNLLSIESRQVFVWLLLMIGMDLFQRSAETGIERREATRRPLLEGALAGTAITLILLFSGSASVPFIYFQF
jgi:hypothetical protein